MGLVKATNQYKRVFINTASFGLFPSASVGTHFTVSAHSYRTSCKQAQFPSGSADKTFESLGIHKALCAALLREGIRVPTRSQKAVFEDIRRARDTVIATPSGTGKTLCYLLPLIDSLYQLHDALEQTDPSSAVSLINLPLQYPLSPSSTHNPWKASRKRNFSYWHLYKTGSNGRLCAADPLGSRRVLPLPPDAFSSVGTAKQWNAVSASLAACNMILPSSFDSSVRPDSSIPSCPSTLPSFHAIATNPLQALRPWVVLVPHRDLVGQVCSMICTIDPLQRVSLQTQIDVHGDGWRNSDHSRNIRDPRIRWGAVDIVVTTPMKFVEDMRRFSSEGLFPACIVFDEVDRLFHDASTRPLILDIIHYVRPRLLRQDGESDSFRSVFAGPAQRALKKGSSMFPTQMVFVGATLPQLGPSSVGCMLPERFCTAIADREGPHRLKSTVTQNWLTFPVVGEDSLHDSQLRVLIRVMKAHVVPRTLVFVNDVTSCENVFKFLDDHKWPVVAFHAGMCYKRRIKALRLFSSGEAVVMVGTNLASRGLDIRQGVDHVINFNMPTDVVSYIHRCGRTARLRSGVKGIVTNFVKKGGAEEHLVTLIQQLQETGNGLDSAFSRKKRLGCKRRRAQVRRHGEPVLYTEVGAEKNSLVPKPVRKPSWEFGNKFGGSDTSLRLHKQLVVGGSSDEE